MGQLGLKIIKFFFPFCFKGRSLTTRLFIFLFLLLSSPSCDKVQNSPIPYIPVDFVRNLNILNELNIPGNSLLFPSYGYGGVIVCCELPGESYYAYDATCTNLVSRNCRVKNEGAIAECPCCGSQFFLLNGGYPSKGPATMPLKQYRVSLLNNMELRVYN